MKSRVAAFVAFCAVLSGSAIAAPPQWVEVRSPHFTVISDAGEKQARHVLDQLERMRWVFQKLFPNINVDPAEPLLVFGAKNGKTFESVEPAPYLKKGQLNLAGYFLRTQDRNYILLPSMPSRKSIPLPRSITSTPTCSLRPPASGCPCGSTKELRSSSRTPTYATRT
jgi:hypothetical protein